jgi:hypothetical protein
LLWLCLHFVHLFSFIFPQQAVFELCFVISLCGFLPLKKCLATVLLILLSELLRTVSQEGWEIIKAWIVKIFIEENVWILLIIIYARTFYIWYALNLLLVLLFIFLLTFARFRRHDINPARIIVIIISALLCIIDLLNKFDLIIDF